MWDKSIHTYAVANWEYKEWFITIKEPLGLLCISSYAILDDWHVEVRLLTLWWASLKNRWKAKNKKFTNVKSYFISYVKINTTIHRTSHSRDHEFGLFWLLLADFKPKMPKFSHFCWFEEYTIYETLIGNWVLRFKWGINQLHRTSHSRDLEFGLFGVVLRLRCLI